MTELYELLVMMAAPAAVLLALRYLVKRQDRLPLDAPAYKRQDWPSRGQDAVKGVGTRSN